MNQMWAYDHWGFVIFNSAILIIFAFSFSHPKTKRDWRSFGAFSAFVVALFTEMYGFPLTIYLFSGWLTRHYPGVNLYSHNSGHLWHLLLGLKDNAMLDPIHILSEIVIFGGFVLLWAAWKVLYRAQREHGLATTGPYARVRHPQYLGFILIMTGFLIQWPTLITLGMFPILVWMYVKLASREEREVVKEFGNVYARYASTTPGFIPRGRAGRGISSADWQGSLVERPGPFQSVIRRR